MEVVRVDWNSCSRLNMGGLAFLGLEEGGTQERWGKKGLDETLLVVFLVTEEAEEDSHSVGEGLGKEVVGSEGWWELRRRAVEEEVGVEEDRSF